MLDDADTTSRSTIVSGAPVPQHVSHELLVEPESIFALLACSDFGHGFALGREVYEEEASSDEVPHSEEELIGLVNHALSAQMYQRGQLYSQLLGSPRSPTSRISVLWWATWRACSPSARPGSLLLGPTGQP